LEFEFVSHFVLRISNLKLTPKRLKNDKKLCLDNIKNLEEKIMTILLRIFRLFKADIHGVMDQIEDQGLLLKQHLRDMEDSLAHKEAKLKQMCFARNQARQDYEKGIKESSNLEQDLEVAIRKDRDDIARMLIKKLKPLSHIQSERCSHIDRLNHEIEQFKEDFEHQRLQYEQLRQQAVDFFHRTEKLSEDHSWPPMQAGSGTYDLSDEEVDLELLQRKEALQGGALS
jgi:phage shock protein A